MNEDSTQSTDVVEEPVQAEATPEAPSELELLKQRADMMGVKYHPSIGAEKLKAKLEDAKAASEQSKPDIMMVKIDDSEKQTAATLKREKRKEVMKKATALRRVRVTCMNPLKKDWPGDLIGVGNSVIPTQKKYIPFNVPWHVPEIIYTHLKNAKATTFYSEKVNGQEVQRTRQIPAYVVEDLQALTEKELKELEQRQAMRSGNADSL